MTKLTVKLESPELPKDSFAAQAKLMYRVGSKYCRVEENADVENGIHGLMIINEPDVWMVNLFDKTAKHIVDPGPSFNCRLPIFVRDVKTAKDQENPLMQLEFGQELQFFKPKAGAPRPGPTMQGKKTMVYATDVGGSQLYLFTTGDPEVPVALARQKDDKREIFWYGEYSQIPFDAKLFVKPSDVKISPEK